jgi:uncharacterized protein YdaU (DUF1376 family)
MNGLPYYKAYPRDFFDGTRGMHGDLKGAYRMVLDLIYQHGGQLYNDPRHISGQLGYSVRKWNSLFSVLVEMGKLHLNGEIISNFRADKELVQLSLMQDKQRENGLKPKINKHIPEATAKPPLSHTEPDTDTEEGGGGSAGAREAVDHEEVLLAAGVDPSKDVTGKWHSSGQIWEAKRWQDDLGLSGPEILAELRGAVNGKPPGSLAYFTPIMQRAAARKTAPKLVPVEGAAQPPPSHRIDVGAAIRAEKERIEASRT